MMKPIYVAATALFAAGLLLSLNGSAFAQASTSGQSEAGTPSDVGQDGQTTDQVDQTELRAPVLHVTSVEILRSTHGPVLDIVRVRGLVSNHGWEEAELVPLTRGAPADGMLDLAFIAKAPSDATEATGFEEIEAIFTLETNHPYKGIRVHGASDSVTVTQFPGYAEGKAAGDDCGKCVGKYFVAKGMTLPAGKIEADVVREESLPPKLRVIKATGGLDSIDSDPNRLTIVVGEDGKIVTAFWD